MLMSALGWSTFTAATALAGLGSLVMFGWFLGDESLPRVVVVRPDATMSQRLAWDALLCLVFFTQHSGMLRRPFRTCLEERCGLPPHLFGAAYTFASAITLSLLCVFWQPTATNEPLWVAGSAARVALRVASKLALLGFGWAGVVLGGCDVFGTRPVLDQYVLGHRRDPSAPHLKVKGPFRWVRHPMYSLVIVMIWASPVVTTDRLLFNVLFTIWIVLATRWEERDLMAAFGDAYRRYQETVPMLIPWKAPAPLQQDGKEK